jgi:hypothetical protein
MRLGEVAKGLGVTVHAINLDQFTDLLLQKN